MLKPVLGTLFSLVLMALVAGLSGLQGVDHELDEQRRDWAAAHEDDLADPRRLSALEEEADRLAERYPNNVHVQRWQSVTSAGRNGRPATDAAG